MTHPAGLERSPKHECISTKNVYFTLVKHVESMFMLFWIKVQYGLPLDRHGLTPRITPTNQNSRHDRYCT